MPRRVPDTSRIRALVGYRPTTTLDGIIESVIAYCQEDQEIVAESLMATRTVT